MRQIQLHEAEEQLAALVAEAEAGESLTIVRDGKAVAQIIPFPGKSGQSVDTDRSTAVENLRAIMSHGYDLGGFRITSRDELYDRDAAIRELDALLSEGVDLGGVAPARDEMHDGR